MRGLHLIKDKDRNREVYFNSNTLELFERVNGEDFRDSVEDIVCERNEHVLESVINPSATQSDIHRITVCVANDCNLRCRYCYAQGGSYGSSRKLMDESTARDFVDFCIRKFNKINRILFFGGEPLLNWSIIDLICTLFKEKSCSRNFHQPSFSIVTNGTVFSEQIFSVIEKHISHVTVSIDGDKIVNDSNRVFPNSAGTYDKISYFIRRVKCLQSVNLSFEATFTPEHLYHNQSRFDVKKYIQSEFGIDGVIVDEDKMDKKHLLKCLKQITKKDLIDSDFENLPLDFWQILLSITTKKHNYFCRIFRDRFTITTDGDVVGCQMLIGKKGSVIGSIKDGDILDRISNSIVEFKNNEHCKACWCNSLCGGCCIEKFFHDKKGVPSVLPNKDLCEFTKLYVETILLLIYEIRIDSSVWNLFMTKCKNKFQ